MSLGKQRAASFDRSRSTTWCVHFPNLTNTWACSQFQGVPRLVVNASERAKVGLDINKAVELWAWTYEKGAVSCQRPAGFSTFEVVD
jgi:hypothetical protein